MLISLIVAALFGVFWLWMFWEMSNNDTLPNNAPLPPKWPPTSKFEWTLAFIFLNLIAAGYYYFTEYRKD